MSNNKNRYIQTKRRRNRGSIIAENASVMYILFILIIFPLIDLSAMSLRVFFFWYSCNQAAMAGAKGTQWTSSSGSINTQAANSIQVLATNANTATLKMFSGIAQTSISYSVILSAIQHSDTSNNQTTASTVTLSGGALPLKTSSTPPVVDSSQYIPIFRVTTTGNIQPFISVPFFFTVPGLNASFPVTMHADQIIENPAALNS